MSREALISSFLLSRRDERNRDETESSVHDCLQDWATELFQYATNLLALNASPLSYLEKYYTRLTLVTDADGRIPVKK